MYTELLLPVAIFAVLLASWAIGYYAYKPKCYTDHKTKRGCCAACRHYAKCNPVGRLVDMEGE